MARLIHERDDVIALVAEVFRGLGYEGASLSRMTERTGLGKGSLYHFFPGGKEEMAGAVLDHVAGWFEAHVFKPLRQAEAESAIAGMLSAVDGYFRSGGRVCLVGAFALEETRDTFSDRISGYFRQWIGDLAAALIRGGRGQAQAAALAEEIVLEIQGALVLSRALGDNGPFTRMISRLKDQLARDIFLAERS